MLVFVYLQRFQVRIVWEQETDFLLQGIFNKLFVIFIFSAGWGIFLCFDVFFAKLAQMVRLVRGKKGKIIAFKFHVMQD